MATFVVSARRHIFVPTQRTSVMFLPLSPPAETNIRGLPIGEPFAVFQGLRAALCHCSLLPLFDALLTIRFNLAVTEGLVFVTVGFAVLVLASGMIVVYAGRFWIACDCGSGLMQLADNGFALLKALLFTLLELVSKPQTSLFWARWSIGRSSARYSPRSRSWIPLVPCLPGLLVPYS